MQLRDRTKWEAEAVISRIPAQCHKVVKQPLKRQGLKVTRAIFNDQVSLMKFFGQKKTFCMIDESTFSFVCPYGEFTMDFDVVVYNQLKTVMRRNWLMPPVFTNINAYTPNTRCWSCAASYWVHYEVIVV